MPEKLDIYDILGVLVPGVLVVCGVALAFPTVVQAMGGTGFPEGFGLLALTAASIFAGYLIQALASMIEGLLNWTWGGRASELALDGKLSERYLPADAARRIRTKLEEAAGPGASTRALFLVAMNRAESCGSGRVQRFNALYAYHRALIVLTLFAIVLFLFSFRGDGFAARLTWKQDFGVLIVLLLLLLLFWHRARQRGFYYVREVLLCAEHPPSPQPTGAAERG